MFEFAGPSKRLGPKNIRLKPKITKKRVYKQGSKKKMYMKWVIIESMLPPPYEEQWF